MTVYYLWREARSGRGPPPSVPAFTNIYIEAKKKKKRLPEPWTHALESQKGARREDE